MHCKCECFVTILPINQRKKLTLHLSMLCIACLYEDSKLNAKEPHWCIHNRTGWFYFLKSQHTSFLLTISLFTNLISFRQNQFPPQLLWKILWIWKTLNSLCRTRRHHFFFSFFSFLTGEVKLNASQQSGAIWESEQPACVSFVEHQLISCLPVEERKTCFETLIVSVTKLTSGEFTPGAFGPEPTRPHF